MAEVRGLPIVKVDPNAPTCEACAQNVELDGGYIKPHGRKYNTLSPPEAVKFLNKKTGKEEWRQVRKFTVGTAFCRRSNRPYPGAVLTKDEDENVPMLEESIAPEDALLNYLLEHPNIGFIPRDLAYACDIRDNRTGKLDKNEVDRILYKQLKYEMPEGYKLRRIQMSKEKYVWAMVVKKNAEAQVNANVQ